MDSSYVDLKKAVDREDYEMAKHIIRSCRLEARYSSEHLLFCAIDQKDLHIISFLLKSTKIDLKVENSSGNRIVHAAAESGDKQILKEVLSAGSSANVVNSLGQSPLHLAILGGFEEAAIYLINEGATINRPRCYSLNEAPIHTASRLGFLKILEHMMNRGSDLNVQLNDGSTPLHVAIRNRHAAAVELLCRYGASTDVCDKHGKSPINLALRQLSISIIQILLPYIFDLNNVDQIGSTPLHYLAASQIPADQHLDIFEMLFDKGVDVDKKDRDGRTALHETATSGNITICEVLLQNGANVHISENRGETPLCTASAYNKADIIKCLIARGATANHQDFELKTPLQKVIETRVGGCKMNSINLLLEHDAQVNSIDRRGSSILDQCCFHIVTSDLTSQHLTDVLMRLISAGVTLKYTNTSPNLHSPLCVLVWQGHLEAASMLIEAGWDLGPEDWVTLPGNSAPVGSFLLRLHNIRSNPVSLRGICRRVIRRCLSDGSSGKDISKNVKGLGLPFSLRDYVLGSIYGRSLI